MLMSKFLFSMIQSQILSNFVSNKTNYSINCHIQIFTLYKDNFVRKKNSMFHLLTFNNLQNHLNKVAK